MDVITTAFLVGTGVVAGIIAAMVGGAAVVIYPALIATGVSPQLAAVSNLASVMPATMLAALSDRSQLPPFNSIAQSIGSSGACARYGNTYSASSTRAACLKALAVSPRLVAVTSGCSVLA